MVKCYICVIITIVPLTGGEKEMFKRSSGVLAHVTSLPSPHGVGTMGKTAYDFVDFLADAHQTYWQVLPLGHKIGRASCRERV